MKKLADQEIISYLDVLIYILPNGMEFKTYVWADLIGRRVKELKNMKVQIYRKDDV